MSVARRILMLHGYSQNASIFSKRLGALRKAVGNDIELVFVDGPIVLQPIDLDGASSNAAYADLGAPESASTSSDPALVPRAWWKSNPKRTAAHGLEQSLMMLRDILRKDRYDGVFGFSQGAAMAALLAALLEKPHAFDAFFIDGRPPHPRFQFCVSVSGFKVMDPISNQIFGGSYETPTLHVLGKTDVVVVEERSRALLSVSVHARREDHEGGHFVPLKATWRNFWRDYLRDPLGSVPSPGLTSQNGSGSITPSVMEYTSESPCVHPSGAIPSRDDQCWYSTSPDTNACQDPYV